MLCQILWNTYTVARWICFRIFSKKRLFCLKTTKKGAKCSLFDQFGAFIA
jgi:hypothetical protein